MLGVDSVVSYGPCQFPTLGFVVERYLQRIVRTANWTDEKNFVPESFWFIQATVKTLSSPSPSEGLIKLHWSRNRLFDELVTVTLYSLIANETEGTVIK